MIDVYVDLVFCNDSVLRVKSYHEGKEIYYPLSDLQSYYEEDESFIIRFFQQNVFFEQNTTLANVILAIAPWQNIISKYTDRDVNAYCAACKKPSDAEQTFSFLEISKSSTFSRHYHYLPMKDDEDLTDFFNNRNNRIKTDLIDIETRTSMCGFHHGDHEHYSASHIAFDKIKHTPIIVASQQKNIFLGKESKLLTENIQGLFVDKRNITACYSPAELSFCEAIYAIFIDGLFYHWPMTQERNDAFNQILEDAMAEFDAEKENVKQPVLKLVDDTEPPSDATEKELKVKVAPGAFDSVFEHEAENASEWDEIYTQLANKSNLKIGKMILSEQDKSFMDQ